MKMTGSLRGKEYIKLIFRLLLGAALCAFVSGPVRAASQVDARLDTTRARIGDRLTLTLTAHSAPGETVSFPDLESHLDKFELLARLPTERVESEGGSALTRDSYVLTSFDTGRLEIPRLPFAVMDSAGTVDTLWTNALDVDFVSVVQDTLNAEIRPLRALLGAPRLWKKIALWAVAVLALLVVLIYLWRAYLRRRARRLAGSLVVTKPSRPAHLVALDELDRIKTLGLIEKGEIKQFHILISDAVRRYLESRYDVDALEMTTWELMLELQHHRDIDGELRALIGEFLDACDLVKFAKYKPPVVEINSTFNRAYEVIEKSRPQVLSSPAPATAGATAASGPGAEVGR